MDSKLRKTLTDVDEMLEDLPRSELNPAVSAQITRVQAQGQYLCSEAYHRHLTFWSSMVAFVITIAIGLGVYYLLIAAGKNPTALHRNLFEGIGPIVVYSFYKLWQTWRKSGDRAVSQGTGN